jgi:hypothetical protein
MLNLGQLNTIKSYMDNGQFEAMDEYLSQVYGRQKVGQLDPLVMPLLIKDEIAQKLIDRLNLYEKQYASDYGFINKQKIAHKVKELKKCIQIVQSA